MTPTQHALIGIEVSSTKMSATFAARLITKTIRCVPPANTLSYNCSFLFSVRFVAVNHVVLHGSLRILCAFSHSTVAVLANVIISHLGIEENLWVRKVICASLGAIRAKL